MAERGCAGEPADPSGDHVLFSRRPAAVGLSSGVCCCWAAKKGWWVGAGGGGALRRHPPASTCPCGKRKTKHRQGRLGVCGFCLPRPMLRLPFSARATLFRYVQPQPQRQPGPSPSPTAHRTAPEDSQPGGGDLLFYKGEPRGNHRLACPFFFIHITYIVCDGTPRAPSVWRCGQPLPAFLWCWDWKGRCVCGSSLLVFTSFSCSAKKNSVANRMSRVGASRFQV